MGNASFPRCAQSGSVSSSAPGSTAHCFAELSGGPLHEIARRLAGEDLVSFGAASHVSREVATTAPHYAATCAATADVARMLNDRAAAGDPERLRAGFAHAPHLGERMRTRLFEASRRVRIPGERTALLAESAPLLDVASSERLEIAARDATGLASEINRSKALAALAPSFPRLTARRLRKIVDRTVAMRNERALMRALDAYGPVIDAFSPVDRARLHERAAAISEADSPRTATRIPVRAV